MVAIRGGRAPAGKITETISGTHGGPPATNGSHRDRTGGHARMRAFAARILRLSGGLRERVQAPEERAIPGRQLR